MYWQSLTNILRDVWSYITTPLGVSIVGAIGVVAGYFVRAFSEQLMKSRFERDKERKGRVASELTELYALAIRVKSAFDSRDEYALYKNKKAYFEYFDKNMLDKSIIGHVEQHNTELKGVIDKINPRKTLGIRMRFPISPKSETSAADKIDWWKQGKATSDKIAQLLRIEYDKYT